MWAIRSELDTFVVFCGTTLTVALRDRYKSCPKEKFQQAEPGMN